MRVTITRSDLRGSVKAPPSKSYTIRGLMCAALAGGESELLDPLRADDTEAAARVLEQIGSAIKWGADSWKVSGGGFKAPQGDLFCGDSAATFRFMAALCALVPGECRLTAGPSLARRPVQPLIDALRQLGIGCSSNDGLPPVTVRGGKLEGGVTNLPGDMSSQFVSALLLISPLAKKGMTIRLTTPPRSEPYIDMTTECMKRFGVEVARRGAEFHANPQSYIPTRLRIEGDWSSASYPLALGSLCGEVAVENLESDSLQADRAIMDLLKKMGAAVEAHGRAVAARRSPLRAVKADLSDCIDLLPTMMALAAAAEGTSVFSGISAARLKESDRVAAMSEGLARMGIKVEPGEDSAAVTGGRPKGAVIDSRGDHRIAMAFAVLGCLAGDTTIAGAECVSKTFPAYWDILSKIGARIKTDE